MAKLKKCMLPLAAAVSAALCTQSALAVSGEDFEFHGYMRSGIGANLNSDGGDQVCFQLPTVGWKYRLGNECENYFETSFAANLYQGEATEYFKLYFTLAYVVEGEADFEQFAPALRELWIESGNVGSGLFEGARFWAGKRFYRRHDVHINDFFFWDNSGPGAGIEDINLGHLGAPGQLAVAAFRGVTDDIAQQRIVVDPDTFNVEIIAGGQEQVTDRAVTRFDLRWYGLETNPGGELTLGVDLRLGNEDTDDPNDGEEGYGINILHFQDNPFGLGGFNKAILQYGLGSASRLGQAFSNDTLDPKKVWSARGVEQIVIEPTRDWSVLTALTYEINQNNDGLGGDNNGEDREWWSFGIRPIYYLTDYFNVAFEYGFDYVDVKEEKTRYLQKFTIAPQLSAGRGFWARPLIRAFVTYADWNGDAEDAARQFITRVEDTETVTRLEDIPGTLSDPVFSNTDGWTIGIQAESWW